MHITESTSKRFQSSITGICHQDSLQRSTLFSRITALPYNRLYIGILSEDYLPPPPPPPQRTHICTNMLHHWNSALDNRKSVRLLFVDYAKAFDHVDHSTFVRKLINFGVPDIIISWICSFLIDRQQRVKMCDAFSSWVMLSGSMTQGSLLGPLTFIVLIDDLTTGCMTHKFVDDTTLSEFINKGEPSTMDLNLTQLLDWTSSNYMNVNIQKTKEMFISPSNSNCISQLMLADVEIERVDVLDDWWNSSARYGRDVC